MLRILAQAAVETTTQAAATTASVFDWSQWAIGPHDVAKISLIFAAFLIGGIVLRSIFRERLRRLRLIPALIVGATALALYLGAWSVHPKEMLQSGDPVQFWLTRLFAAAMLFVGLQLLDRLAIVPLLTHRGKMPLSRFVHQIANIVLALFGILIYGSVAFGWDIDRFLAGSAVVSIVLGLALQESLGNFFSGLVMQASPPFAIGNWIVCGEHEGRVVDMTWRAVTIHTNDDNFILIPNATVAKAEIVNFHAPTTATARKVKVGLESDVPPESALAVLKRAAMETPGVLETPPPFVYLEEFADSSVNYAIKFWISEPASHRKIEHLVRVNAWYRLREKGIVIPNPTYMVEHINQSRIRRSGWRGRRARGLWRRLKMCRCCSPCRRSRSGNWRRRRMT